MTAEMMRELKPGDRVKIVDYPPKGSAFTICDNPHETEMGKWLGTTMTVKAVKPRCCDMKEDGGKWAWTPMLIERKVVRR